MRFHLCASALVLAAGVQGRVLHVAVDGANTADGTPGAPFASITSALAKARPGDTVQVHAGIYVGRVSVPASGTPRRPIVIQGERDEDGTHRTIIDSSAPLNVDWKLAPEIGEGVYRTPFPGYEPRQMLVDGRFIPRIWRDHMADGSGFEGLAYPSDHVVETRYQKQSVKFWDPVGAMFGTRDGVVYLRFRDGRDPNTESLRSAPAGGGVHIEDHSHIVLRDVMVRGGENCVMITGAKATHNRVERCRLANGSVRVHISAGAAHNVVRNCEMTIDFFAKECLTGAWGSTPIDGMVPYELRLKQQFYLIYKYFFGPNGTSDYGVRLYQVGPGNEISHNRLTSGGQGISVHAGTDVNIHHNTVQGFSSLGLICTLNRVRNVRIHENVVSDCNINLRIHHVNERNQAETRSLYLYRNRFWNPRGVGSHIYFHYNPEDVIPTDEHARIFIYHNSFAGGQRGVSVSSWAHDLGGLPQTVIANNIISSDDIVSAARTFIRAEGMFGVFDHNWLGGGFKTTDPGHDYTRAPWYGAHNRFDRDLRIWSTDGMPDFRLPGGRPAKNAELDLSHDVTIGGERFGPLPGVAPDAGHPIGAY